MNIRLNEFKNRHGEVSQNLYIDNKNVESIYSLSESPEDAIIGRSLIDGNDIIHYMTLAYDAGKKGESFIVSYTNNIE